jgi:signal transduction histidine kinase
VRADDETVFKDGGAAKSKVQNPKSEADPKSGIQSQASRNAAVNRRTALRLPPGRARVLEIRYTANTFVDSELARFRYRLEGHETEWHEARTRRAALYTNLRPGAYRFRVEACNRHGYWSQAPAEFAFSLAPYFYQTWQFSALAVAAFASGLGGWHVRRLRARSHLRRLEQARALQDERGRIAKDLHDDLGANLTGIAMQIEVASQQLSQPVVAQNHLQKIAESVRLLVGQMREVIWSLNPECDRLESFCSYVCEYAETFLSTAGLSCRLDLPERLPDHALSAETRHQLLLVVKEALNNAARHAAASEVQIRLSTSGNALRLGIADNGHGFVSSAATVAGAAGDARGDPAGGVAPRLRSGYGLDNMRRRVASLGGSFSLQSQPGRGTQITIHIPLRPPD